jgi:hypothetical protein
VSSIDITAFVETAAVAVGEAIGKDIEPARICLQEQLRGVAELASSVEADYKDAPPHDANKEQLEKDIKRLTELALKLCEYYDQMVAQKAAEAVVGVFWSFLKKAW